MKVTVNWLKEYVEFNWSPEELAERLTMLGLEVEGFQKVAGDFEGIVVAQVITRDPHPNADRLSLCRVQDGQGERQIVCGAQNFKAGDKVPLILPGATLPLKPGDQTPFTIKVGKIRGVESHGMLCSPQELGLADDVDGLLILRPDAVVGQPFAQYLGRSAGDVVLDLEITPNRPDLNSVLGVAREIAAVTGNPLRLPKADLPPPPAAAPTPPVGVRIEAPDLCHRYHAQVLRGVKVGPSPDWLRATLEKVGVRSINNVVDVTNYVMLETGQPLHAFDYHLVAGDNAGRPTIVVRRARADEPFTTLDGQSHTLTSDQLLIADASKGIALAGVMGGQNTEINDRTVDVLLESAWFLAANTRRTSRSLGLRTDASYRFERGVDIGHTDWASRRATALILQLAGGRLDGDPVDAYPQPFVPRQITLRPDKANALLGLNLKPEEMECYLAPLGLKTASRKPKPLDTITASYLEAQLAGSPPPPPDPITFTVPTWRPDLKREIDLIEEVARLYGVDRIPSTPPRGAVGANAYDTVHDQLAEIRRFLSGLGLHEAQGQTLVPDTVARLTAESLVHLANPLSSDMNVLRPSLLPGLLHSLQHNLSRRNTDIALFEIGRVFLPGPSHPVEERRLALAITGRRNPTFWAGADRDALADLFDLKGILEEFLDLFGLRGCVCPRIETPGALFVEAAAITLGGKVPLGQIGQLHPSLARQFDLRDPVFLAELNVDELLGRRITSRNLKSLPAYPGVRRDIALLVPEAVSHTAVLAAVRQAKAANLETVELFDVFRGTSIPSGHKSIAYAFTYRHAERTLTDAEVNTAHDKLVTHLTQTLGATPRAMGSHLNS